MNATDKARLATARKRVERWERQRGQSQNDFDKHGVLKRCKHLGDSVPAPREPETILPDKSDQVSRLSDGYAMRSSADKLTRTHRDVSLVLTQGHVSISKIDGHQYGSVQVVGRSLEEYALERAGYGPLYHLVVQGQPPSGKRTGKNPYAKTWGTAADKVTVVIKKGKLK